MTEQDPNQKYVDDKLCCTLCPKDILHACVRIYQDGHPPCAINFKSLDGEEISQVTVLRVIAMLRQNAQSFDTEEESAFNYYMDLLEENYHGKKIS